VTAKRLAVQLRRRSARDVVLWLYRRPRPRGHVRDEVAQAISNAIGRAVAATRNRLLPSAAPRFPTGENFSISDGTVTTRFEFESGYSLQIPDPAFFPNVLPGRQSFTISSGGNDEGHSSLTAMGSLLRASIRIRTNDQMLQVPFGGVLGGAIQEVRRFSIQAGPGGATTIFEFDTDGLIAAGSRPVSVLPTDLENAVAIAIVQAISSANLGLSPRNLGQGQVQLGVTNQVVDVSGTPTLLLNTIQLSQDEVANRM